MKAGRQEQSPGRVWSQRQRQCFPCPEAKRSDRMRSEQKPSNGYDMVAGDLPRRLAR